MRIKLLIAVLSLAAAFDLVALVPAALAQTTTPAAAEKLAAPVRPGAVPAEEVASKNVSIAEKAQKCLKIEDKPDDRLHCYDDAVRPQPNPNPPPVKGIRDCRHIVDVDQRLSCFDGFAVQIPKFTH
jgi:flagellar motility protein MotE (MotC chaperone)